MTKKIIKIISILVIIVVCSTVSFLLGNHYSFNNSVSIKGIELPSITDEAIGLFQINFYKSVSKKKLEDGSIYGVVEALNDPYTQYVSKKNYKGFETHITGSYSGVGVVIAAKKGRVFAVKLFDDGPAKKAGIKKGDEIVKIDKKIAGKMTIDQAASLIRGDAGTKVRLTISRNKKSKVYVLTRQDISLPNIVSRMEGKDTGYIVLHSFTNDVGMKMGLEIDKLKKKGATKLILDLRGNPGGQVSEAINIASLFLQKGVVLKSVDKNKHEQIDNVTGDVRFDGPMVVLVDEGSASASEIVSGALKDHKRATLIGSKTFGKGCMQNIVSLSNGGALVITSQQWFTPSGVSISEKGIKPDIAIKDPDKQLSKAIDFLKDKLPAANL